MCVSPYAPEQLTSNIPEIEQYGSGHMIRLLHTPTAKTPLYQCKLFGHAQLASERGQREHNRLAERHSKMLRELHEATAAATALKADNAEKLKQLQLKEDALKAARSDVAKVIPPMSAEV